jgi:hypothetical protein
MCHEKTGNKIISTFCDERRHYKLEPGMIVCIEKTQNQDGRGFKKIYCRVYKEEAEGGRKTSLILTGFTRT